MAELNNQIAGSGCVTGLAKRKNLRQQFAQATVVRIEVEAEGSNDERSRAAGRDSIYIKSGY